MSVPIINTRKVASFERITPAGSLSQHEHRWIGRCKKCGQTHKLEGQVVQGWKRSDDGNSGLAIQESGTGHVYLAHGSSPYEVVVPCGDHWCKLRRVVEGTKGSKHECGVRCTNATGPDCECRCRGKNHGSNC